MITFPDVDATQQDCLTDEQAQFFRNYGLLVIRRVVRGEELRRMQAETGGLIDRARAARVNEPDYAYAKHEITGQEVPHRIEYVIDKTTAGKALLGHPFILRSVEKLQGRNFIPTWDSLVFKAEGAGKAVPWHRDGGREFYAGEEYGDRPIFNVDFYLDPATLENCLWGIPGSNQWTDAEAQAECQRHNTNGFDTAGAVPIPMQPGDVIFHNILVLHGSPPTQGAMRRTVYYEFRPGEIERDSGPHVPEYIPLKQRELMACLRDRARASYVRDEKPFLYRPTPEFAPPALGTDEQLPTYRYPHKDYWRKS